MSQTLDVEGVSVIHWNPKSKRFARLFSYGPPKNNFGDLLGPAIVRRLVAAQGLSQGSGRLAAIGSILHFVRDGDVLWGIGRNGKIPDDWHKARKLEVHAVRGPLTRAFLESQGVGVPDVFGDPGILVPRAYPELSALPKKHELTVLPNLHDMATVPADLVEFVAAPTDELESVLRRIAQSERVVASSLHGKIVADALGVPATLVESPGEGNRFKYDDYNQGVGRGDAVMRSGFTDGVDNPAPFEGPIDSAVLDRLLEVFPTTMWSRKSNS